MKKPLCSHCGERHYLTEPHLLSEAPVTVSNEVLPKVTALTAKGVTRVTPVTEGNAPHCPTCRCFGPKYATKAEKQRAYRERKREE
jgi:tRNA(Ile2) C34 agmatinyltransferase TiaS